MVITLDQLISNEIPNEVWDTEKITDLKIQKTQPKSQWSSRPPLSWYETVEFTAPYWILNSNIGRLKNLESLTLVDLDIRTLPDSLTQLQNLRKLNVSFNKLEISNEIEKLKQLKNLEHLTLYGNHYDSLEMQKFQEMFPALVIEFKGDDD